MAPNVAETVFALGAGDRVVGVSEYTTYPPEAKAKRSVGALHNPNLEMILALEPDLVIIQQKHDRVEQLCGDNGIPILRVDMEGISGIFEGIQTLGTKLGGSEHAQDLCRKIRDDLDAVRKRAAGKPRVKVLFSLGRMPGSLKGLFAVGKSSFLTELIEIAGGENIFSDVSGPYLSVSVESLLVRAPEVIIETYPSQDLSAGERRRLLADWQTMSDVPAVRRGRIHLLTEDYIVVPGPRIARIAERLAGLFHPEESDAR